MQARCAVPVATADASSRRRTAVPSLTRAVAPVPLLRSPKARFLLTLLLGAAPVRAQLKILAPDALAHEFAAHAGVVYGTTATFGAPYYGERVKGRLVYGTSGGRQHCTADDYHLAAGEQADDKAAKGGELANVVLVERGGCTFVAKVQVAQDKGAKAVIVVDEEGSRQTPEELQRIIMADDGFGDSIRIPSMMISRPEGERLIAAAQAGEVLVELAWDIPRGEVVIADFWMSAGSEESGEFLERFKDSAETLKYHLQFVPHYHVFQLPREGDTPSGYSHLCAERIDSCGSCGVEPDTFCAPDPDGPGPVTGGDVANEDLRQICIWNTTVRTRWKVEPGAPGGQKAFDSGYYSREFWDYVVQFRADCPVDGGDESRRFGYRCSVQAMQKVGINVQQVEGCIESNYRPLLGEQTLHTAWSPQALRLNGARYSGPLDPELVLKAVCSGYSTMPAGCEQLITGYRIAAWRGIGQLSVSSLVSSCLAVAICLGVLFRLYRRHVARTVRKVIREEVMMEVMAQMSDYVPFEDSSSGRVAGGGGRVPLSF